jgi:hypothetical protein
MRKTLLLLAIALLGTNGANAQLNGKLGKVADAVTAATSSATSGNGKNSTLQSVANIISSKLVPNSKQIVGTWAYQEPAVMFTSSNALKSAAGSMASASIEKKLQSYLSKVGIKKGKMTITFDDQKNFSIKNGTKTVKTGTYTLNDNTVTLTFKGKTKPCKVTPQLDNGTLVIVMDATSLKNFMGTVAGQVSSLSTVTSLLNAYDGMKVGLRMSKQ